MDDGSDMNGLYARHRIIDSFARVKRELSEKFQIVSAWLGLDWYFFR